MTRKEFPLLSPCHFGLEAVLKRELTDLGFTIDRVEDGRVFYHGGADSIARANIALRTTERVLLVIGEFTAVSFDELFEKTKAVPWEEYIPQNGKVWVTKAHSVRSALFSPTDIQSIMKKAIVERMKKAYRTDLILENGASFPLRVSIHKDLVTIGLDTSGISLHKRGYRTDSVLAPISETLAAGLLLLTPWNRDRILMDPFAGSGTFPIEAAMMAINRAPGLSRSFSFEDWPHLISRKTTEDVREEFLSCIRKDIKPEIYGFDIDPNAIQSAKENAKRAGVSSLIQFSVSDVKDLKCDKPYGFILTNPPYGERIAEKEELPALYHTLGERFSALTDWSLFVITPYEEAENAIGRKADKNRKIYNGMIKTYFYSFMGKKPPKKGLPSCESSLQPEMKEK